MPTPSEIIKCSPQQWYVDTRNFNVCLLNDEASVSTCWSNSPCAASNYLFTDKDNAACPTYKPTTKLSYESLCTKQMGSLPEGCKAQDLRKFQDDQILANNNSLLVASCQDGKTYVTAPTMDDDGYTCKWTPIEGIKPPSEPDVTPNGFFGRETCPQVNESNESSPKNKQGTAWANYTVAGGLSAGLAVASIVAMCSYRPAHNPPAHDLPTTVQPEHNPPATVQPEHNPPAHDPSDVSIQALARNAFAAATDHYKDQQPLINSMMYYIREQERVYSVDGATILAETVKRLPIDMKLLQEKFRPGAKDADVNTIVSVTQVEQAREDYVKFLKKKCIEQSCIEGIDDPEQVNDAIDRVFGQGDALYTLAVTHDLQSETSQHILEAAFGASTSFPVPEESHLKSLETAGISLNHVTFAGVLCGMGNGCGDAVAERVSSMLTKMRPRADEYSGTIPSRFDQLHTVWYGDDNDMNYDTTSPDMFGRVINRLRDGSGGYRLRDGSGGYSFDKTTLYQRNPFGPGSTPPWIVGNKDDSHTSTIGVPDAINRFIVRQTLSRTQQSPTRGLMSGSSLPLSDRTDQSINDLALHCMNLSNGRSLPTSTAYTIPNEAELGRPKNVTWTWTVNPKPPKAIGEIGRRGMVDLMTTEQSKGAMSHFLSE